MYGQIKMINFYLFKLEKNEIIFQAKLFTISKYPLSLQLI